MLFDNALISRLEIGFVPDTQIGCQNCSLLHDLLASNIALDFPSLPY
jgi:hypothetical protein